MNDELAEIIAQLELVPLEREGGMFAQTYASADSAPDGGPAATAIYYLLADDAYSHLHRLTGDEIYHFYLGDPVELLELAPDGTSSVTTLGPDILHGQEVQHLVRAGVWQGSRLANGGAWALLGTTMHPGYSDARYEHGNASDLIALYPERAEEISALAR